MRRRTESGSAVVEVVWLGILLLIPMVWIVLSVFEVQRGAFGVTAAARAAGRAYALAPDDASGQQQATAAAAVAMADQGLDDQPWRLEVSCGKRVDCHVGGAVITVRVETHVALPFVPDFLGGQTAFALDAEHDVPIGQYQEPGEPRDRCDSWAPSRVRSGHHPHRRPGDRAGDGRRRGDRRVGGVPATPGPRQPRRRRRPGGRGPRRGRRRRLHRRHRRRPSRHHRGRGAGGCPGIPPARGCPHQVPRPQGVRERRPRYPDHPRPAHGAAAPAAEGAGWPGVGGDRGHRCCGGGGGRRATAPRPTCPARPALGLGTRRRRPGGGRGRHRRRRRRSGGSPSRPCRGRRRR